MDGTVTMPATQLDRENPWPGLESFEENARDYFHGREAEAEDLLRRVSDAPLTVLFGKSGLGKTSLLKAGLFPRLREKNFLPVHVRLDIRPDAPELGEQLRDALLAEIARKRVDAPPFAPDETLWEYLHRADLELWNEQNYPLTPVLVLDQFEEVFTLGERLPNSVEGCKIDLGDLAENRIPAALASRLAIDPSAAQGLDLRRMAYKLVVTLREDFLPHLESWRTAVPSLGRVRVRLLPMRPEQALSAVYDTAPHLLDEPLARRIVAFVAAAQIATTQAQGEGAAPQATGDGEIEPALLSLFCRGLNERRKQQGANRFDEQLLEGAQQGIIADYYRSCVEGLSDSVSRFIEADLITEKGFRNSYAKDDAVPAFLTEEQLDRLINRRLLRVEERYGTARIELTHDLLTRAVMADRDRRRVEEEKASLARRAEEERQALAVQARTQRRRVLAMAFVTLICLAFAGVAAWQWWAAVTATKAAEEATRVAEKAQASSEARRTETEARLIFDDSEDGEALVKATLLSVASVRHTRTVDGQISLTRFLGLLPKSPLWRRSVAQPANVTIGHGRRALAVSPDGARIAAVGGSGPVQLLDAHTGQPLRSFEAPQRRNTARTVLAFSPDGAFLVLGCGDQACVLDASSGQLLARLPSATTRHGDMVWSASFSPDGQRLAMSSYHSSEILVYDVATWHTTATIHSREGAVFSVAFSPGGKWLATGASSGLQLWRVGHDEAPAAQVRTAGLVWSIAFQPDSSGLITAGQWLQAWNIVEGDGPIRIEAGVSKTINAHTVLPVSRHDRSCFAAAARDAVYLLCNESLDEVLRIPVSSAAAVFSPDGRWLFNEQNDGILAGWPLDAGPDALRTPVGAPVLSMASAERWLAAGTDSGEVAIVGVDTWKARRRLHLPAPAAPVDKVTASSDGRWLVVAQGPSLRVFDANNWREVASKTYGHDVEGMAFNTGNRWLIVVTSTTVAVWQPGVWRERRRLKHDARIDVVRVSPNGRQLATTTHWGAGHDSGVHLTRLFDLASGNEIGWEYTAGSSSFSQQFMEREAAGRQQALAGGDTASVQEAASSWPALELKEPSERVSTDGIWNVSVSGSVARLRDIAVNRDIGDFDHGDVITSVRFVPSRAPRWLVSAGDDGTLAVWRSGRRTWPARRVSGCRQSSIRKLWGNSSPMRMRKGAARRSHDECRVNLILFLGSGVSRASGLPLAGELTEVILGSSTIPLAEDPLHPRLRAGELRQRIESLLRIMADFDTRDAKRTNALFRSRTSSYEDLFYLCEEMTNWRIGLADNSTLTSFMKAIERRARPLLSGPNLAARLDDLGLLASEARLFIQAVTTTMLRGGEPAGLDLIVDLARSGRISQLNIVTLNHDTLVEQLMEKGGLELTDGFGPPDGDVRWYDDRLYDAGRTSARLFKLHGSVSWYRFVVDGLPRTAVVRRNHSGDVFDGKGNLLRRLIQDAAFLTGGNKAIRYQHGIYLDLLFRFQEVLRGCDVILMCGYGWGDAAINLRLETWMDDPRKRIVLLHPDPEEITARSMIIASAYNWWVSSGRLITVPQWLSQLSLGDIDRYLFDPAPV
ncbi:MAG TPA: hypothetical protein VEK57_24115 [Thermoanaerobaculia bacterium]|nr:hypothetical protein [Thermoanaerobaculia bacterium]